VTASSSGVVSAETIGMGFKEENREKLDVGTRDLGFSL